MIGELLSLVSEKIRTDNAKDGVELILCPDCKGTGKYIGLNRIKVCPTCKGA